MSRENVFSDLELDDSEAMKAHSDLMSELVYLIHKSGLPHKNVALILNIGEPKVTALMSGKINDFSADALLQHLTKMRRSRFKSNSEGMNNLGKEGEEFGGGVGDDEVGAGALDAEEAF